jgi:hypothetical protein
VTSYTDVVTANVLRTLRDDAARLALGEILACEPDLVGLQEWGVSRHRLLRETGSVRWPFRRGARWRGTRRDAGRYVWVSSLPLLGGCPVGARADRFDLLDGRIAILGGFGRADRGAGLVREQLAMGRTVYALGDSNFDGLGLPRLTSAWMGRDDHPGTLAGSRRRIDDVHGPRAASSVTLLPNASDHRAVLVRRADIA